MTGVSRTRARGTPTSKRRRITHFLPRLWARHRDLATRLKLDLEVALRDATARDATERAAVEHRDHIRRRRRAG